MPRALRRNVTRSDEPVNDVDQTEAEEATPRRGRRTTAADTKPSRRGGDDDKGPKVRGEVASGWDGYDENREEYGDYAPDFGKTLKEAQDDDEDVLFKFVDDAPFAVYKQHWIERKGKRSFNCIASKALKTRCPICDEVGDRPGTKVAFNVISLHDPENPRVEIWTVGQKVADMIKKMAKEKRTSPLNRDDLYFAASRTGTKGGSVQTNIEPVKERDLKDDWDTEPLTEAEVKEFYEAAFDEESVDYPTVKQMEEIVDELV